MYKKYIRYIRREPFGWWKDIFSKTEMVAKSRERPFIGPSLFKTVLTDTFPTTVLRCWPDNTCVTLTAAGAGQPGNSATSPPNTALNASLGGKNTNICKLYATNGNLTIILKLCM